MFLSIVLLTIDRWLRCYPTRRKESGRKGVSKVCRVPAVGLRAGDLKCTGCGPSAAGRAITGPKVRYKRMTCLKPLYLQLNSRSPDGVGRSRCEPVGLLCCLLVNARRAFVCGSSCLAHTPEPQGVKRRTYGSKVDRRNTGTTIVRLLRSRLSAETGDGRWWGGACVVVRGRESRPHGEGGQEAGGLS
jgi:hypothetical protein